MKKEKDDLIRRQMTGVYNKKEEEEIVKRIRGIVIGVGIAFMVLALILQSITQAIPSLLIIFKYGRVLKS